MELEEGFLPLHIPLFLNLRCSLLKNLSYFCLLEQTFWVSESLLKLVWGGKSIFLSTSTRDFYYVGVGWDPEISVLLCSPGDFEAVGTHLENHSM